MTPCGPSRPALVHRRTDVERQSTAPGRRGRSGTRARRDGAGDAPRPPVPLRRRPSPVRTSRPAVQPDHVEPRRLADAVVPRRRPAGSDVSVRPHLRRLGSQHHRDELSRSARCRRARLSATHRRRRHDPGRHTAGTR